MKSLTSAEITASMANCSKRAAAAIQIPPLDEIEWHQLDFLAWRHPRTPDRAYLVTQRDGDPVGLELRAASGHSGGAMRSSMCDLCHTVHSLGGVRLFAAAKAGPAGRRGDTLGIYACADLSCNAYIRGRKRPARVQPMTTLTPEERSAELTRVLDAFVARVTSTATA